MYHDLTIFTADDVTPLLGAVDGGGNITQATCSTDPAHPRPYLQAVAQLSESELGLLDGTSKIGQVNIHLVDKRTVAANQNTGWFTALLSDLATGKGQLNGHRAVYRVADKLGVLRTVMDGVLMDPTLEADMVQYTVTIKDIRERERKSRLFTKVQDVAIFPPGLLPGWGVFEGGQDNEKLIPPLVAGVKGNFQKYVNNALGGIIWVEENDVVFNLTDEDAETAQEISRPALKVNTLDGLGALVSYPRVAVMWRLWGSVGAWTTARNMPVIPGRTSPAGAFYVHKPSDAPGTRRFLISLSVNSVAEPLPIAHGAIGNADVEVILLYDGPPSEDYPLFIETRMGQLLKDIYDGVYSDENPRIRYSAAAMAALVANSPMARGIIKEPADDIKGWVEPNLYKPYGLAPALDDKQVVSPISYKLPDATVALTQLIDGNVESGRWSHSSKRTITKAQFFSKRAYLRPQTAVVGEKPLNALQRLEEREVEFTRIHADASFLGYFPIEWHPETVYSVSRDEQGSPQTGDSRDDLGNQLAALRTAESVDRFFNGGQEAEVVALRSDVGVEALKVGSWCQVNLSWMPDYVTQLRGINRIMQVEKIQDISPIQRRMLLVDAGPYLAALAVPTLGVPTFDALTDMVTAPVTAVVAEARADMAYVAAGGAAPGVNDPAWRFAGRRVGVGDLVMGPLPLNTKAWVRLRAESPGKRPSAWTVSQGVNSSTQTSFINAGLQLNDDGTVTVRWTPIAGTGGVRAYWAVFEDGQDVPDPTVVYVAADGVAGILTINPPMRQFQSVLVKLVSYPGFAAGDATGAAGRQSTLLVRRADAFEVLPSMREQGSETEILGTLTLVPVDPQGRLTVVEAKTKAARGAWSGWAALISPYSATVVLQEKLTSHIAYRLSYVDRYKQTKITEEQIVPFVAGAKPMIPDLVYKFTEAGALTVVVSGDSDTASIKVGVSIVSQAAATAAAAVATSADGRTSIWAFGGPYSPAQVVYISALAYSQAAGAGQVSEPNAIQAQVPNTIQPLVQEQYSEANALGTLTLVMNDPQARVRGVVFRTKSGRDAEVVYAEDTSVPFTQTVVLVEGVTSYIGYDVIGQDGSVVSRGHVPFAIGNIPVLPLVTHLNAGSTPEITGRVAFRVEGDSDARSLRVAIGVGAAPADAVFDNAANFTRDPGTGEFPEGFAQVNARQITSNDIIYPTHPGTYVGPFAGINAMVYAKVVGYSAIDAGGIRGPITTEIRRVGSQTDTLVVAGAGLLASMGQVGGNRTYTISLTGLGGGGGGTYLTLPMFTPTGSQLGDSRVSQNGTIINIDGSLVTGGGYSITTGLYFVLPGGALLQQITGSYGSLRIDGAAGGYAGIYFASANTVLMIGETSQGGYREGSGWQWHWTGTAGTEFSLAVGKVPAARVQAGTFAAGAFTVQTLTVSSLLIVPASIALATITDTDFVTRILVTTGGVNFYGGLLHSGGGTFSHEGNIVPSGGGTARIGVMEGVDGGSTRGIRVWGVSDSSWGIYMGQSGAGKSMSGGAAVAGYAFSAHALRLRVGSGTTYGFIIENSSEELLFSMRGDGVGAIEKLDVFGGHVQVLNGYQLLVYNVGTTDYSGWHFQDGILRQVNSRPINLLGSLGIDSGQPYLRSDSSTGLQIVNDAATAAQGLQVKWLRVSGTYGAAVTTGYVDCTGVTAASVMTIAGKKVPSVVLQSGGDETTWTPDHDRQLLLIY